jgi:hypothetical protein
MKTDISGRSLCWLILALCAGFSPLSADETRSVNIEVNLIIDGSAALATVLDEVTLWVSGNLVDRRLQEGDRIHIWNAGETAEIVYSGTLKSDAEKEQVRQTLRSLPAKGGTADFTGALREAAARSSGRMSYTLLVSASPAALSPALTGPESGLMRFSRIEEFPGWRLIIVALNIDSRVRQAAAAYFSGT